MAEVKVVRLKSGEDVICEYFTSDDSTVVLKNPVQVSMVPTRTGDPNFAFIPFPLTTNDKEIFVKNDYICFVCSPAEEFLNQYNQIFGSGIVTPTKKIIV